MSRTKKKTKTNKTEAAVAPAPDNHPPPASGMPPILRHELRPKEKSQRDSDTLKNDDDEIEKRLDKSEATSTSLTPPKALQQPNTFPTPTIITMSSSVPACRSVRYLVLSLGNPFPYDDTLHSAGHLALAAARRHLAGHTAFGADATGKRAADRKTTGKRAAEAAMSASVRDGGRSPFTLVYSPSVMNVSGRWALQTWRQFVRGVRAAGGAEGVGLVLVHDDMESALGTVRTRAWTASARGHNGVKSVVASVKGLPGKSAPWARVTVGIGRPEERNRDAVSKYVLRKLTNEERRVLGVEVGREVARALEKIVEEAERSRSWPSFDSGDGEGGDGRS